MVWFSILNDLKERKEKPEKINHHDPFNQQDERCMNIYLNHISFYLFKLILMTLTANSILSGQLFHMNSSLNSHKVQMSDNVNATKLKRFSSKTKRENEKLRKKKLNLLNKRMFFVFLAFFFVLNISFVVVIPFFVKKTF